MRFFRSIVPIVFITAVALVYVHQQIELVKLSYSIDCKEKKLRQMLDRNDALSYNIQNLEDPSRLEQILMARKVDIGFPKRGYVFSSAEMVANARNKQHERRIGLERKPGILSIFEFLSPRAEAQAKER